ncbi:MAG: hypothetical protein K2I79_00415, partial [Clostridia bacterium]|nr:hypothetical protein [Clostridia bacterium]
YITLQKGIGLESAGSGKQLGDNSRLSKDNLSVGAKAPHGKQLLEKSNNKDLEDKGGDELLRALKNESFLPYTKISDDGNLAMAEVRRRLNDILEEKRSQRERDILPSQAELDSLLKKYF